MGLALIQLENKLGRASGSPGCDNAFGWSTANS
jgi:hypothetical protein